MRVDAEAALRLWAVEVDLSGVTYRIPPTPAGEWLPAILAEDWLQIVPGMLDADDDAVDLLLDSDSLPYDECMSRARQAVTEVAGMPWWAAVRLVHIGTSDASVAGELTLSGVDWSSAPLARLVQAVYRICTREADTKAVKKFDAELLQVPPGVDPAERFDEAEAAKAFEAMFAAR